MGAPWKSGKKPSHFASKGSTGLRRIGTRTNRPQRPKTTLGMPARSPMGKETTDLNEGVAISVRKSARPMETGSAITSPTALVTRVP